MEENGIRQKSSVIRMYRDHNDEVDTKEGGGARTLKRGEVGEIGK